LIFASTTALRDQPLASIKGVDNLPTIFTSWHQRRDLVVGDLLGGIALRCHIEMSLR
jgi:hypothetical protein